MSTLIKIWPDLLTLRYLCWTFFYCSHSRIMIKIKKLQTNEAHQILTNPNFHKRFKSIFFVEISYRKNRVHDFFPQLRCHACTRSWHVYTDQNKTVMVWYHCNGRRTKRCCPLLSLIIITESIPLLFFFSFLFFIMKNSNDIQISHLYLEWTGISNYM